MEKIGLNELRIMFREFYESKGHMPRKSFSLIPENDKSLLVINSGMAPFKPYFAGILEPPSIRMTTCQKCLRTGDLENVGYTARHGTFFEMMGSFSFGDYFKKESLVWGWEFITEVLKMPVDKLWASVYLDDDEAFDIWVNDVGIAPERVVRLGKDDNFWEIGIGPCGPCSEVFFDRGEKYGCDREDCKPGCECDRYVEFWNHVFTQFDRDEDGNYTPLSQKNIDTGLGLERLACIMQDTDSIFNVDTIRHVLEGVTEITGEEYHDGEAEKDVSIRIITDHIRSVVFMISDGIMPSNEGRGYVLRRLLRRACVHGRKLGIKKLFLEGLADRVIDVSGGEYDELIEKRDYIHKIIRMEEERFESTIDQGSELLGQYVDELKEMTGRILSGEKVFKLYDTHGFNPELTREILSGHGIEIDEDGYLAELKKQQELSRQNMRMTESESWKSGSSALKGIEKTVFTGYETTKDSCRILKIFSEGEEIESASEGDSVQFILDKTPFYAESGGQASDTGELIGDNSFTDVDAVDKFHDIFIHYVLVKQGTVKKDDVGEAVVDKVARNKTARNHTATHLLHAALKQVIGEHVNQSGSSVDTEQLRFDFTHYEPIPENKLNEIEMIVNRLINEFIPVETSLCSLEDAKSNGAVALFDEKYGDEVRVIRIGEFSSELCGGTHVNNSGEIGIFKITSEGSVGAGMRRIEAITGTNLLKPLIRAENVLGELGKMVKANPEMLLEKISDTYNKMNAFKAELDEHSKVKLGDTLNELVSSALEIPDGKLVTGEFEGLSAEELRSVSDEIRENEKDVIAALASITDDKLIFIVAVSNTMQEKGHHAGKLVKELAQAAGGGGGGKADIAQAGAKDVSKLEDAFEALKKAVL